MSRGWHLCHDDGVDGDDDDDAILGNQMFTHSPSSVAEGKLKMLMRMYDGDDDDYVGNEEEELERAV